LFKGLFIFVYVYVKDHLNAFGIFRSLCIAGGFIGVFNSFFALKDKNRLGVWFTVNIKTKLKSYLPLIPAITLLLYLDYLTFFFSISFAIRVLK
jgi:hypothetical protein